MTSVFLHNHTLQENECPVHVGVTRPTGVCCGLFLGCFLLLFFGKKKIGMEKERKCVAEILCCVFMHLSISGVKFLNA